ncbi:PPM-type phosphatase domain-containing protein [Haematococcus lacustris]|uniref:PPM-type phosphatase domain-containing protein n=1 Tax=Haematococcus lacustris TaxID=44745 RepID=A0A699ZH30_HAELA|nr:PPM-type phosphatase domain-containing protein [Haematococcus lacustris]
MMCDPFVVLVGGACYTGSVLALADGVNWGEPARRAARCAVLGACAHLHQALAGLGSDPGARDRQQGSRGQAHTRSLPGVPPEQGGRDRAAAGWQLLWPRVCRCGGLGTYQMVVLPQRNQQTRWWFWGHTVFLPQPIPSHIFKMKAGLNAIAGQLGSP